MLATNNTSAVICHMPIQVHMKLILVYISYVCFPACCESGVDVNAARLWRDCSLGGGGGVMGVWCKSGGLGGSLNSVKAHADVD